MHDLRWFSFYLKLHRIFHTCANLFFSLRTANSLKALLEQEHMTDTWKYGFILYRIGSIYAWILRDRINGSAYFDAALARLEAGSHTNEEIMWLAFFYREMASLDCRDEYLFQPHDPMYISTIEHFINSGEKVISELQNNGFTNTNINLYYGTLSATQEGILLPLTDESDCSIDFRNYKSFFREDNNHQTSP